MVGNRKSEELIDPNLPEKPSSKERRTGGESLRSHGNYHHEQKDSNRDRKQIGEEITD
ncbi:hypothetical protein AHAS_Ahas10G0075400 [Arachis hypogaea]